MAELLTLGTGSKGNCYILTADNGDQLLLDCGVKRSDIVAGLNFSIARLHGCLVTHAHADHCKAADDIELMGIPVWKPYADENKRQIKKFGSFSIQSFPVPHDGENCVGYYIKFDDRKLLYMTDLEYCGYNFYQQKITDLLIECNYMENYTDVNLPQFSHKILGHLSLKGCLDFIKCNQTPALTNIIICHMSNQTLDVAEAIQTIKETSGIENVYAAEKNKTIYL